MITIKKPMVKIQENKAILTCKILIDKKEEELFYEIDKEYKEYLTTERADAFVIAALYYAMKHHHDITCDIPITSALYHNITTYIIPTLAKHSNHLSNITLNMPITDEPLQTKGEVGTGMSCGIDSLHTLKNYLHPTCKEMKLTCLCLNNVGSFKAYDQKYRGIGSDNARDNVIKRAEKVAKEVNLPLIVTNSNVYQIFNDTYFRVHTFANMFSVFLLQKLFGKYYYASSGYDLSYYNITDSYELDSAEYDILTFYSLQTPTLKIYPEGNEKTRMEKTIALADFDLARKHLHVCIKDSNNCGKCLKCRRTLLALEALGKLDNFDQVFDINYYKEHKKEYYNWLEKEVTKGHLMNTETADLLNQKNGDTIYEDIELFNEKNIILPELDIDSISIKQDNKYVLNKDSDVLYETNLYYRLLICLELANQENKEIKIPKYLLDNVKVYYKNQKTIKKKLKYIKSILKKKQKKINIHDLIYFLLYKPSTFKNIIYFLEKEKYIENITSAEYQKSKSTTQDLVDIFVKISNNKVLKEIITIDEVKISGKVLKNINPVTKCQDTYYKNDEYQTTFVVTDQNYYYFFGQSSNYTVVIVSENTKEKFKINKDIRDVYGLIKKLNE